MATWARSTATDSSPGSWPLHICSIIASNTNAGARVLYGKYRPQGFEEVVGQDHIVTTLRNALATGQVAHAYLFSGPRGTGKTTTARIVARALNCTALRAGEPCNACPACRAIAAGNALDLIEMDAASNRGIDDIRELRERIAFAPSDLARKVYLLDEVHMLTDGAFNALLKTLEEPPPHAFFILATTELHKVPATIISRCQRYDFHRVPNEAITRRLRHICEAEGFSVPPEGLLAIAIQARGGLRDAITLLEQAVARYGPAPSTDDVLAALGLVHDERSETLAAALIESNLGAALGIARQVADDGIDIARFTRETIDILREAMLASLGVTGTGTHREAAARLAPLAKEAGGGTRLLARAIGELARADFRLDPASPVPLEIACATAILGANLPPAAPVPAPAAGERPARAPARQPAAPGGRDGASAPSTREEQFMQDLYDRCKTANSLLGAWLNGSCEVLAIGENEIELGFYNKIHLDKVDRDCRTLVEQQAQVILEAPGPVHLKVRMVERTAGKKQSPKGGHLAEAAKALGATPVPRS